MQRNLTAHPTRAVVLSATLVMITAALAALPVVSTAQTPLPRGETPVAPPLGLPRLASPEAGASRSGLLPVSRIAGDRYAVDTLLPRAGVVGQRLRAEGKIRMLELDAGSVWTRPLRFVDEGPTFVSILLYGSPGTEVRLGGMSFRLGEAEPPGNAMATLLVPRIGPDGMTMQPAGVKVPFDLYEGRVLAPLPVLTVRLDAQEKCWDLFIGPQLTAVGLPLLPAPPDAPWQDVGIKPGGDGARLLGLVESRDNPFYEDADRDAVPDAFAQQERRALPGLTSSRSLTAAAQRRRLAEAWRDSRPSLQMHPVERPLPDARKLAAGKGGVR